MIRPFHAFAVVALTALAGCNTVSRGTTQTVGITSDPAGATCSVEQGGRAVGTVDSTPGTLVVQRIFGDLRISCAKPGYTPATMTRFSMQTDMQGLGIFAVGNLVDLSSGANNSYPATTRVALTPISSVQ